MSPPQSILIRYSAYLAERLGVAGLALFQGDETISFSPAEVSNAVAVLPDIRTLLEHPESSSWIALARMMQTAPLAVVGKPLPGLDELDESRPESNLSEFSNTLADKGLRVDLVGWTRTEADVPTLVATITNSGVPLPAAAPEEFRVIALISTRNESDIIGSTIEHLVQGGIDAYVIDDESTDDTLAIAQSYIGRGVIGCESFSVADPANHWYEILRRKEELAQELPADWFLHQDADEIHEGPWPGVRLKDAIYRADHEGYSCLDFTVLEFRPTDNAFKKGDDPQEHFRFFEFGTRPGHFVQTRAWKSTSGPVGLAETGGHSVSFLGARTHPYKFLVRHYPIRSQAHGEKKIQDRAIRYAEEKRARNWHGHYFSMSKSKNFLAAAGQLTAFDKSFYARFLLERTSGLGILGSSRGTVSEPAHTPAGAPSIAGRTHQQHAVVCIAGMHRSGTSLLARMLNLCGLYLGEPGMLLGAGPHNPEGHWENVHFLNINDAVLASLDGAWDLPPAMPPGWTEQPRVLAHRHEAEQLIISFADREPWGWKDPRNTLTFPFWQALIPDLKIVACLRDPLEVAHSLAIRGASSVAFSMNLWQSYNSRLLNLLDQGMGLITHFDALMFDAEAELARVLAWLHLQPAAVEFDRARREAQKTLKHHESRAEDLDRLKTYPEVLSLYSRLCEHAGPTYARLRSARAGQRTIPSGGIGASPIIPEPVPSPRVELRSNQTLSRREPLGEPLVSVVIPNHNGCDDLQTCLRSLDALDFGAGGLETIVVDNGSSDSSLAMLRSEFPQVTVIRNHVNAGFSVAANQGAAASKGAYVAFLNNDMRVHPHWLSGLLEAVGREAGIACAGSLVLNWEGTAVDFYGRTDDLFCIRVPVADPPPLPASSDASQYSLFASGGAMLIRAQLLREVGGFDSDYFMYHEDVDLGWHLWLKGLKCVLTPQSVVFHKGAASSARLPRSMLSGMQLKNMLATTIKHMEAENLQQILPLLLYFLLERGRLWYGAGELPPRLVPEFTSSLESLLEKRRRIQSTRVLTDEALFTRFHHPFAFLLDQPRYEAIRRQVLANSPSVAFDVTDADSVRVGLSAWLNGARYVFEHHLLEECARESEAARNLTHRLAQHEEAVKELSARVLERQGAVEALLTQLGSAQRALAQSEQATESTRATLAAVYSSRSWRLMSLFQRLRRFLVPHDSPSEKILRLLWRTLRRLRSP